MNTRLLLLSVMATFFIVSCSSDFDDSSVISTEENVSQTVEPVNFDGQFEANQLNDCLLNKISATLATRSSGETTKVYPDYYGGSFIEKDGTLRLLIRLFRDMFDHPALEFKQLDRIENESTFNVYPGARAYVHTTNDLYGSFAFRAREKSGQRRVGVVTAGHVTDVGDFCYINDESSNRKTFGECVAASKEVSKADAAFIVPVAGDTVTLSNLINDNPSSVLSTVVSNPGVGTYVNMWGASTGNSGGYIQSTTVKVLDDNDKVRFTDMTSANYTSSGGDSGGIIYTYLSSKKVRYTVGIHHGGVPGKNTAVFTKASNALSI